MRGFVQGLCDNKGFMHVGAAYQIGKVRLEKMGKGIHNGNKDLENNRVDLLQDYCFTFVHNAVKRLEEMTKSAREKKDKTRAIDNSRLLL